jgi:hypothetical protein
MTDVIILFIYQTLRWPLSQYSLIWPLSHLFFRLWDDPCHSILFFFFTDFEMTDVIFLFILQTLGWHLTRYSLFSDIEMTFVTFIFKTLRWPTAPCRHYLRPMKHHSPPWQEQQHTPDLKTKHNKPWYMYNQHLVFFFLSIVCYKTFLF